jgi:hypothetical protein
MFDMSATTVDLCKKVAKMLIFAMAYNANVARVGDHEAAMRNAFFVVNKAKDL